MMSCLNIFTISLSCQKQLEQGTYEICDCMYWSILIAPAYASENTVYNYNMNGGWNNIHFKILHLRCSAWFWGHITLEFDF